jgi:hypothetical protein
MALKKTSGGDSPLRQGVGKSFWNLPISARRRRRIAMCFWKIDRVFRFFPSGGLYRRRAASEVDKGGHTRRGHGPGAGPRRPVVWPTRDSSTSPLRSSGSFVKYLDVWLLFHPIPRIFPV